MTTPDRLERLREALEAAGYTEEAVRELAGPLAVLRDRDLAAGRLDSSPLATLVMLFGLGTPVPRVDAEGVLGPLPDFVRVNDHAAVSDVGLTPYRGLYFLHDPQDPARMAADSVTGVNSASKTLASLTVRRPAAAALDVGTGCGVQALLAARHSDRVVATDVNARALEFTELNARLNGLTKVECRRGSLFDPAEAETFGLTVSNPPYVISPDSAFVFRDSGRSADEISHEVVSQAPGSLDEGGFATVLANWVVRDPDDPWAPLENWLESSGCDCWLLHYGTQTPTSYAAKWNAELRGERDYAEAVARWLAYYEQEGIDAIGFGAVVLRRRSGENWTRKERVALPPSGDASDQILRVFEARDRPLTDETVLDARLALVEPHRLDQSLVYEDGAYAAQDAALVLENGVGLRPAVDPHAIHVLFGLDGERPLRELIAEAAEITGLDRGLVESQTVTTMQRLYEFGFATRAIS